MSRFLFIAVLQIGFISASDDGQKYFDIGDFEEARKYYETIIQQGGDVDKASFGIGASAYKMGDIETAIKAFEQALNTEDTELKANACYNMGNSLYKAQRMEESMAFYKKALELNPKDRDAKYNYEMLKYQMQSEQKQQEQGEGEENKEKDKKDQDQDSESDQTRDEDTEEKGNQDKDKKDEQKDNKDKDSAKTVEQDGQNPREEKQLQPEDKHSAEQILNALKQNEKILQKRQIARSKSRKLEKDW